MTRGTRSRLGRSLAKCCATQASTLVRNVATGPQASFAASAKATSQLISSSSSS